MIQALESLKTTQQVKDEKVAVPAFHALKISTVRKKGLISLFATHPPLEERINRLEKES
jgi:Zn-dependent protease with chaperone function